MKLYKILLWITTVICFFLLFNLTHARVGGGGVHNNSDATYDCLVTKKPSKPKWVTGIKSEKLNDGQITLTWADSARAHKVEIKYTKTKKTGDDSREIIKGLKNGKVYSFKIRGVSNCGKSGWSKVYKATP